MEWCWDHKHTWGLSAESVMLSNGSILWHTHGKVLMTAFSPTLCDLKFGYFGWPEKITQVCNLSRARISKEIWNVFKKNKFVRFLYWCKGLTISVLHECGVLFRSCVRSYGTVEKVLLDGNFWERLIGEIELMAIISKMGIFESGWSRKFNLWRFLAKYGKMQNSQEEFDCHTE